MKKLLILFLTSFLLLSLTGCGNNNSKEQDDDKDVEMITSKSCTLTYAETGLKQTFVYTATSGVVDKVKVIMVYDNDTLGYDVATLTEEQKQQVKANMLDSLDLDSTSYEGLEIIVDIQEQMTVTLDADLKKADDELLQKVGLDFTGVDMNLDNVVKEMTDGGAVCN